MSSTALHHVQHPHLSPHSLFGDHVLGGGAILPHPSRRHNEAGIQHIDADFRSVERKFEHSEPKKQLDIELAKHTAALRMINNIVVSGLGSMTTYMHEGMESSDYTAPMVQLALTMEIVRWVRRAHARHLSFSALPMHIHEPMFEDEDLTMLNRYGIRATCRPHEDPRQYINNTTLYVFPHLDTKAVPTDLETRMPAMLVSSDVALGGLHHVMQFLTDNYELCTDYRINNVEGAGTGEAVDWEEGGEEYEDDVHLWVDGLNHLKLWIRKDIHALSLLSHGGSHA